MYIFTKLHEFGFNMEENRLHKIRKKLRLSQEEIADETSITYRAYTSYERGDRKPSFEFLVKLVEKYNVNLNWLIAGKGEMFLSNQNFASEYESVKNDILKEVRKMFKEKGL